MEDDAEEEPRKRQKKHKPTTNEFQHAEKAGKKFMANYCAFAYKDDIFHQGNSPCLQRSTETK